MCVPVCLEKASVSKLLAGIQDTIKNRNKFARNIKDNVCVTTNLKTL